MYFYIVIYVELLLYYYFCTSQPVKYDLLRMTIFTHYIFPNRAFITISTLYFFLATNNSSVMFEIVK